METANIYSSLAAISREIKSIGKNQRNAGQGFNFRGVDDVMNELHNSFAKHGVVILPKVDNYEMKEGTTSRGAIQYHTLATVTFTYVAEDGSCVQTTNVGEAMDMADKGINKAMSAALKYSLLQLFLIPTVEKKDPDYYTPEETYRETKVQIIAPAQKQTTPTSADPKDYNPYAAKVAELRALTSMQDLVKWYHNNMKLVEVPEIKNICKEVKAKLS